MMHTPFILGILQCDSVLEQFQPQFGNYPSMLSELFIQAAPAIEIKVYDVQHDHYPSHLDECNGYVTTGSKASVYDDEIWIKQLEDFILALHQARKKLIGICFGHQLIAQALGGKVSAAQQGWGVGVHTNKIHQHPNWLHPVQETFNLVVSHKDQVTQLPIGAKLIAYNDFCPHAAFQIDSHILTVQGHPEFSKPYAETLMKYRRKVLGEKCYSEGIESLAKPTDHILFTQWMVNFMKME